MLFLDRNIKTVLSVDGYRSVKDFKFLLDYVDERAYQDSSLTEYLEQQMRPAVYTFRDHLYFDPLTDLSTVRDKPLMVIFEDDSCTACDALHENIFSLPATLELMARMAVVRLDARSRQPIVDAAGYRQQHRNAGHGILI